VSAPADQSLAHVLAEARHALGLSLREVERRTGIRNAHLSQIETGTIARPEMALLWELSIAYGLDFARLLSLAGYEAAGETAADRGRMTVALRALGQLTPAEQAEALEVMAELRRRRGA
jgi:transcriptional regulator with XRE-family HTH domain